QVMLKPAIVVHKRDYNICADWHQRIKWHTVGIIANFYFRNFPMAIDYIIDYACVPKETLTTNGIVERIKARERANAVIKLFREKGDQRPPSQMGFEFPRTNLNGEKETRVIVVQEMLDQAAELAPLAHYCEGCPANVHNRPFGCIGQIEYPIS